MGEASRRVMVSRGRRAPQGSRRPPKNSGSEGERRMMVQLAVSLALFLLVYIGRGVFPAQLEAWRAAASSNVDFRAAFQRFGADLSQGEPVHGAVEALLVTLLGGEAEQPSPSPAPPEGQKRPVTLLGQTAGGGLAYLHNNGLLAGGQYVQKGDEPVQDQPEPAPSQAPQPQVVTAMAQEYTDDGVKLPRNVSLAFYELGLSETAVPVNGSATSGFGYRDSPINGKNEFHLALDIGAEEGAEIGAFAAGTVRYIGTSDEFGNYLMIDHDNNVSSFYAHCSKLLVHKGDQVACGQTVALVGHTGNATGPHLHLTIEKDDIRLDPAYYVDLS